MTVAPKRQCSQVWYEAYVLMRGCGTAASGASHRQRGSITHGTAQPLIRRHTPTQCLVYFRSSASRRVTRLRLALVRGRQQVHDQHHPVSAAEREFVAGAVEVHAEAPQRGRAHAA